MYVGDRDEIVNGVPSTNRRSNGKNELGVGTISPNVHRSPTGTMARMFIDHRQEQWPEWLGMAEFAYNNKVHTGTKMSPFKANNGQDPSMGFEMRKKGKYEGAERFAERMKNVQEEAKVALQKA